jgi:hypothetical protein
MKAEVAVCSSRVNLQLAKINFATLGKVVSELHLHLSADVLTTVGDLPRFGGGVLEKSMNIRLRPFAHPYRKLVRGYSLRCVLQSGCRKSGQDRSCMASSAGVETRLQTQKETRRCFLEKIHRGKLSLDCKSN